MSNTPDLPERMPDDLPARPDRSDDRPKIVAPGPGPSHSLSVNQQVGVQLPPDGINHIAQTHPDELLRLMDRSEEQAHQVAMRGIETQHAQAMEHHKATSEASKLQHEISMARVGIIKWALTGGLLLVAIVFGYAAYTGDPETAMAALTHLAALIGGGGLAKILGQTGSS